MNIYLMKLAAIGRMPVFDKPNEGAPGGGTDTPPASENPPADPPKAETPPADPPKAETPPADPPKSDDEKAALLREVMDKKAKIREKDEALAEAQRKLEAYKGVDPEKIAKLLEKEQKAEQEALEAKGEFDRVKQMMADQHKQELEAIRAELERERAEREQQNTLIDNLTLGNAFSTSKFIANDLILSAQKTRVLYGDHFELKGGEIVAYDKPKGAENRTMLVDASGNSLGFDAALAMIVDADPDKASVRKAKMKPGSSSKSEGTPATPPKTPALTGRALIAQQLAAGKF